MASETGGDISMLPEGCIANVLAFTSPPEACKLSLVSSLFGSAAESDAVWERFLPPDYQSIITQSSQPSLLTCCSAKKQLYLTLCDNPILIDNGKKSFSLDKCTGKKCYMLSASDLVIIWGDTPRYWKWTADPHSRFGEVAELISVCWLEIHGKINTSVLSPMTLYSAFLVFKSASAAYGFDSHPAEVAVGLVGSESCKRTVYLDEERRQRQEFELVPGGPRRMGLFSRSRFMGLQASVPATDSENKFPKVRGDGWLEVELGELFIREGEDGELEMSVLEIRGGHWKSGLIVQGIEIRPKEVKK